MPRKTKRIREKPAPAPASIETLDTKAPAPDASSSPAPAPDASSSPAADRDRDDPEKLQTALTAAGGFDLARMRKATKDKLITAIQNTPELFAETGAGAPEAAGEPVDVNEMVNVGLTGVAQAVGYIAQWFNLITADERRRLKPRRERVEVITPRVVAVVNKHLPSSSFIQIYHEETEAADSVVGMFREMLEDLKKIPAAEVVAPRTSPAPAPVVVIPAAAPHHNNNRGAGAVEMPDGGHDLDLSSLDTVASVLK